jgi:hypothetical protein
MSDSSDFDTLIKTLEHIESLNGRKQRMDQQLGSAGNALQPSLADRLRSTSAEAENRASMEKAMRGESVDEEKVQGIVHEYIRENILKEFGK